MMQTRQPCLPSPGTQKLHQGLFRPNRGPLCRQEEISPGESAVVLWHRAVQNVFGIPSDPEHPEKLARLGQTPIAVVDGPGTMCPLEALVGPMSQGRGKDTGYFPCRDGT